MLVNIVIAPRHSVGLVEPGAQRLRTHIERSGAGDYPIHIIVKSMRVTLIGVVENDSDKMLAYTKAREVSGAFEVKNELMVEKSSNQP